MKYHPEDSVKRKEECKAALEKRIDVFSRFLDEKRLKGIKIDGDQSDTLVKLLDSVVIFLEGGSDFDLDILDQEQVEKTEEKKEESSVKKDTEENDKDEKKDAENTEDKKDESNDRKRKKFDDDSGSSSDENEEEPPAPGKKHSTIFFNKFSINPKPNPNLEQRLPVHFPPDPFPLYQTSR